MSSPAVAYARQNQPRFLKELKDLLRIPSISTLPENKADCRRVVAGCSLEACADGRKLAHDLGIETRRRRFAWHVSMGLGFVIHGREPALAEPPHRMCDGTKYAQDSDRPNVVGVSSEAARSRPIIEPARRIVSRDIG